MRPIALAAAALLHTVFAACQGPPAFNITAISAKNNASRLECWQLDAEPVFSRAATNFDLGEFGDGFVGILAPRTTSDGTLTNAQTVQYASTFASPSTRPRTEMANTSAGTLW